MGLLNVKIKLKLKNQTIEGTFRGLIQASAVDILLLGNKRSSLLLLFSEANIESISIKHTDALSSFGYSGSQKSISSHTINKQETLTEVYEPYNKQEAYSILMNIYSKYKGTQATINTENFNNITAELQYSIKEENNNTVLLENYNANNYVSTNQYTKKHNINLEPKIIKEGMDDFMNKVLGGHKYKRNYWKSGYSGQLVD